MYWKKFNLPAGLCSCRVCTPRRVSSGLWFYSIGKKFYAEFYVFTDKPIKEIFPVPVNLQREITWFTKTNCVAMYQEKDSAISLNGFCKACTKYLLQPFYLTKIKNPQIEKWI